MNRVLELWSGNATGTLPWADHGYEIITVDNDPKYNPTICKDILDVTVEELSAYGPFDFIWASPECRVYSVANLRSGHWLDGKAVTDEAREQNKRVQHTLFLIENLGSPFWVLENPRGMLRKQSFMDKYQRVTVTYCQYGDFRQKPTDLWGWFPNQWHPLPMCKPGSSCHQSAARGADRGTQSQSREQRIAIPYALPLSFYDAAQKSNGKRWANLGLWTV